MILIFITRMAQYAIQGYEVNALDFMVKPVGYYNFCHKLEKAMRMVQSRQLPSLVLRSEDGIVRVGYRDILYIEKDRNNLVYHTDKGDFSERGTLQEKLPSSLFCECASGYLVNLQRVTAVKKDTIELDKIVLPISRRMRKAFMEAYIESMGGLM